jgi:hypothetical protein
MGTGVLFLPAKLSEDEVNFTPPSNAEVKNVWSYISIPQKPFFVWGGGYWRESAGGVKILKNKHRGGGWGSL